MSEPAAPSSANAPASTTSQVCGRCGGVASGKFCSHCGAPLAGAACAECGAPLSRGANFCHRCGTAARAGASGRGFAGALPWAVAGIALVSLIALVAGQRFAQSRQPNDLVPGNDRAGSAPGAAPDISNLTPGEAAGRLYNLVMAMHERGQADSVRTFAPMAIAAYQMIGNLNLDQRYDLGRIGAVSRDSALARAQA